MSKAIKLIVSGFESSGKSSITSKIQDVLVINFDQKEYSFEDLVLKNNLRFDFAVFKN